MDNMIVRTMKPLETARVQELFETVYRDTFTGNVPAFDTVTRGERIYVALLNGDQLTRKHSYPAEMNL